VVLSPNRPLFATAVLAYTLGLRHALDADHIAAIDLMTRRLIASGRKPVAVGMYFSLGHSTVVVLTSIAVAATSASLSQRFDSFSRVGGIIGTGVSAAFLMVLAGLNAFVLWRLTAKLRGALRGEGGGEQNALAEALAGAGCLTRVFKGAFRIVDREWKMYPLGVLCMFSPSWCPVRYRGVGLMHIRAVGLGFDTSSEVALLGIASIQAASGTSIWLILIFPLLFTAGMCLLDTTDGALMSALYQTSTFSQDIVAVLYYSIALTAITVLVAVVIGTIQLLSLIYNVAEPTGRFWDGVEKVGEYYDIVGGSIVALFLVGAVVSVLVYKPWRRWEERRRIRRELAAEVVRVEGC